MADKFPAIVAQEDIKDTRKEMCNSMSLFFVVLIVLSSIWVV